MLDHTSVVSLQKTFKRRLTKANLANHIMNNHGLLGIHVDMECVR